jgi:hypothetical protein
MRVATPTVVCSPSHPQACVGVLMYHHHALPDCAPTLPPEYNGKSYPSKPGLNINTSKPHTKPTFNKTKTSPSLHPNPIVNTALQPITMCCTAHGRVMDTVSKEENDRLCIEATISGPSRKKSNKPCFQIHWHAVNAPFEAFHIW